MKFHTQILNKQNPKPLHMFSILFINIVLEKPGEHCRPQNVCVNVIITYLTLQVLEDLSYTETTV